MIDSIAFQAVIPKNLDAAPRFATNLEQVAAALTAGAGMA